MEKSRIAEFARFLRKTADHIESDDESSTRLESFELEFLNIDEDDKQRARPSGHMVLIARFFSPIIEAKCRDLPVTIYKRSA